MLRVFTETFDTLHIQYKYNEHDVHEEVSCQKIFLAKRLLIKQPFCMAFVFSIVVFFIDYYCAGVCNKHCLLSFFHLL